ncbi:MAG TPA: peptidylprolyl isomerase [Bacteroidales bacterium]|nr:peptidylprolyl isomerase [Bacteroidales bacterium]
MKKIFYLVLVIFGFSCFANAQSTKVLIETSMGNMTVELYDDTPEHRDNFIKLANEGFYEDLLFHRVINGFMIQGGDPDSKGAAPNRPLGNGGPGYTLPAEFNAKYIHKKGALAAARTGDHVNPEKRSSGSQFYIVQGAKYTDMQMDSMEKQFGRKFTEKERDTYATIGGTPHLDTQYTVFGEVVKGLEVIDKIASVKTYPGDRPVEDVKILKVSVIK